MRVEVQVEVVSKEKMFWADVLSGSLGPRQPSEYGLRHRGTWRRFHHSGPSESGCDCVGRVCLGEEFRSGGRSVRYE